MNPSTDNTPIPTCCSEKSFEQLHQEGLLSHKGVYKENLELLKKHFPLRKDEVIVSVVGIFTMTLALTTDRLIGMMGSRLDNLTFITIEYVDIDPASVEKVKYKVHFTAKDHQFSVPNNTAGTFDMLLKYFIKHSS
jgi:hypothetical protein